MQIMLEGAFWIALSEIMLVNLVLSGDNAVVIALACRNLPIQYRRPAILAGSGGAIVLRIIFCVIVAWLLQIPYLKIVGALLLFWIGVKLINEKEDEGGTDVAAKSNLWGAIQTIVVADAVMSLDNAIAIAAAAEQAAKGDSSRAWLLIVLGLLISIPIIVFGSTIIMRIMQRYPVVIVLGGALLGFVAGEMLISDLALHKWLESQVADWLKPELTPGTATYNGWMDIRLHRIELACGAAGAVATLAFGIWLQRRSAGKEQVAVDLARGGKG